MTTPESVPFRRSRGMRDLLPADMRAFRRVEDAFRDAAGRWGYDEVRTPTLETYSLFTVAGGLTPDALSRVYTFLDWDGWSGERIVVRPDSTIPVARAAAEAALPMPARLCYVQNRFLFSRSEEAEHWQCGLEFLAAPETTGDVEVATVALEALEDLGLPSHVRLSHVGVARAAAGLVDGPAPVPRLSDIRAALGDGAPAAALLDAAMRPSEGPQLARNLSSMAASVLPAAVPALDELDRVARALAESGRSVIVDLAMPVDFEYYAGVVFELERGDERLGSGGRYTPTWSGLAPTACGMALGLAHIAALLGDQVTARPAVSVIAGAHGDYARAIRVARALHRSGVAASLDAQPAGPLAVRVQGDTLVAVTPTGERLLSSLDELVALLISSK